MAEIQELVSFLTLGSRVDVKSAALQYVLGLTVSDEGKELLKANSSILKCLFDLLMDKEPSISSTAHVSILNLSSIESLRELILELNVIRKLLDLVLDENWVDADKICMILSNLTHSEKGAMAFLRVLQEEDQDQSHPRHNLHQLVDIFDRTGYNKNADFHYLATVFLNLTQIAAARDLFLDRRVCIVPRLLPYTQFTGTSVRRGGVVGLLRNLCFEVGSHQWLLSEEVDLLSALLLPLAGPEQFEEKEMESFPDELQYLPDDKEREEDPGIRKMCIEAIMKLCSTKFGREFLRSKQTYLVLREYHKWETDQEVRTTCEKLIHILIADEPEAGMEDLHKVELPSGFVPSQMVIADNVETKES